MGELERSGQWSAVNELLGTQVFGSVLQAGRVEDLHVHVAADAPARIPRQLPSAPDGFINRRQELEVLESLLATPGEHCRVVVLSGLAGVGKTGLGLHWAHSVADRFAGGQLYVDLAALRHRGGVEIGEVLAGFLRALSVREEWIPLELAERAALFRSLTAGSRMLVLVDNVDQPAQVAPLIPGSAGSMVLVTSRRRLGGLVVKGATPLHLSPLDAAAGMGLLSRMLTDSRVGAEPEAAAELVGLCGGLPIALRVCGAWLVEREGHRIGRLSANLSDEKRRLKRLTAEGKAVVEDVFDTAYASLPESAAMLYRRLGAHPGPEFSLEVIAAVAELDEDEVTVPLETLLNASLLQEIGEGRYRFHDLVRLHARAHAGEDPRTRHTIVDWYVRRAQAADWAVMGNRLRIAEPVRTELFENAADALDWLEIERPNLLAVVRTAAGEQWDAEVWQLGEALWPLFDNHRHHADELEVARLGVESARHCGDRPAEAKLRFQRIRALLRSGEVDAAARQVPDALSCADDSGHRRVLSAAVESSGMVRLAQGDHAGAIEEFERAKAINAEEHNPRGVGMQSLHIGITLCAAGRWREAVDELGRAMDLMRQVHDELSQGKIGIQLGEAYVALGQRTEATVVLADAFEIMTNRKMVVWQVRALDLLAESTSEPEEAEQFRERARAIRSSTGTAGT